MFFQRKKKRLLRELWRARLTKPPAPPPLSAFYGNSCLAASPQPPPASCYWPATATHAGGDVIRPVDGLWTHQETSTTTTKERPRTRQSFCLMGHCCGDAHSTCSSVSSTTENQPRRLAESPMDVDDEEAEEKAFLAFLGKNLAQRQLETLLEVASARAETTSACVLLRRQEALNWSEDLPVIACRMWRWADLDVRHRRDTLKRIPSCPNGRDPVYICCNPSHWFRVLQPEMPPPPYSAAMELRDSRTSVSDCNRRRRRDSLVKLHRQSCSGGGGGGVGDEEDLDELPEYSEDGLGRCGVGGAPNPRHRRQQRRAVICDGIDDSSMTMMPPESSVSTHGQGRQGEEGWARLAYWEQSARVGPVMKVLKNTVNVVSHHPVNDDLCVKSLAEGMPKLAGNSTREKIGAGIMISHEGDSMWIYNRSEHPVFVHSLSICDVDSILGHSAMIHKLFPGHCMRAYNPRAQSDGYQSLAGDMCMGPVDVHSVQISFVKGWGQTYKRQDIKSCPCWLEVILNPCHFNSDCYDSCEEDNNRYFMCS